MFLSSFWTWIMEPEKTSVKTLGCFHQWDLMLLAFVIFLHRLGHPAFELLDAGAV